MVRRGFASFGNEEMAGAGRIPPLRVRLPIEGRVGAAAFGGLSPETAGSAEGTGGPGGPPLQSVWR